MFVYVLMPGVGTESNFGEIGRLKAEETHIDLVHVFGFKGFVPPAVQAPFAPSRDGPLRLPLND